jgi:hypothetical protein
MNIYASSRLVYEWKIERSQRKQAKTNENVNDKDFKYLLIK